MKITAFELAQRFVGQKEADGPAVTNPQILAMLQLDDSWPDDDSVPWCSAFVNYVAWLLRLPRSKKLRARSWLTVGRPIRALDARAGFDVAILSRGVGKQPGPENLVAPGHVGFYAGHDLGIKIFVLGGNQSDQVSVAPFSLERVLGLRRLREGS